MPLTFLMAFFSKEIFATLFLGDAQAMSKVPLAQSIFVAYLVGLLFFSLNKVFLAIFYALRVTTIPLLTTFISIAINYSLNRLLMHDYGTAGIAFSSSVAAIAQSLVFIMVLRNRLNLSWPFRDWLNFLMRYALQLLTCGSIFWFMYLVVRKIMLSLQFDLNLYFMTVNQDFFIASLGFWLWVGPLVLIFLANLYFSRRFFGIKLSYFD